MSGQGGRADLKPTPVAPASAELPGAEEVPGLSEILPLASIVALLQGLGGATHLTEAERRAVDDETEAGFDNMPV